MPPKNWASPSQQAFLTSKVATYHELININEKSRTKGEKKSDKTSFINNIYKEFEDLSSKKVLDEMSLPRLEIGGTEAQRKEAWKRVRPLSSEQHPVLTSASVLFSTSKTFCETIFAAPSPVRVAS